MVLFNIIIIKLKSIFALYDLRKLIININSNLLLIILLSFYIRFDEINIS